MFQCKDGSMKEPQSGNTIHKQYDYHKEKVVARSQKKTESTNAKFHDT